MINPFTVVPDFLRNPGEFFNGVSQGQSVGVKARSLAISSVVFLMTFGFVTGLSHSLLQALSSAVKMPVLFMSTVIFCLPAFYFFSLVLGTKLSIGQITTIVLSAIGVTAFLLLGFSPITLFFVLTSDNFAFFRLLAVIFVAISGSVGVYFLWHGMAVIEPVDNDSHAQLRRILLSMWFGVYGFIGSQMAWRLSPFINDPTLPFEFIRPTRDNFYIDASRAFVEATGLQTSFIDFSTVLVGVVCLIPLVVLTFSMGKIANRKNRPDLPNVPVQKTDLSEAGNLVL
jgi:hypothetical protein